MKDFNIVNELTDMYRKKITSLVKRANVKTKLANIHKNKYIIAANTAEAQARQITELDYTISNKEQEIAKLKELDAANKSYRDLYNELREAIGADKGQSPGNVLLKVERMKKKIASGEAAYNSADKLRIHWKNKYKRIIALINKNKGCYAGSILTTHRSNELKLKGKVK